MVLRLPSKEADAVQAAFDGVRSELGDMFSCVFKTITTDNGSEFSRLSELIDSTGSGVFFTHPYTSCEKSSIENHNGLLRRFIRKGKSITDYTEEDILFAELWTNQLPRKILGYKTRRNFSTWRWTLCMRPDRDGEEPIPFLRSPSAPFKTEWALVTRMPVF